MISRVKVNAEMTLAELAEAMTYHNTETIRYGKLSVVEHYRMGRIAVLASDRCKVEGISFEQWIEEGGWTLRKRLPRS